MATKKSEPPKATGRPTKCTPETQTVILNALERGNYAVTAARLAGIDEATYYNWVKAAGEGREPYAAFLKSVKEAESKAEDDALKRVQLGATGTEWNPGPHWTSAMTFLERRWPDRWGKRDPHRQELAELERKLKQAEIDTAEAKLRLLRAGYDPDDRTINIIVPSVDDIAHDPDPTP